MADVPANYRLYTMETEPPRPRWPTLPLVTDFERLSEGPARLKGKIQATVPFEALLARRGYYVGRVRGLLAGARADAYDSPDDRGPNREFWMEMTLASDPSVRFVIARSDDAPMGGGTWLDGAYVFRTGRLERL